MKRLLSWKYWLPRIALAVVGLIALEGSLGWLVGRSIIRSGEKKLGTQVDLARSRLSLMHASLSLDRVELANPVEPEKNLISADRCELVFARDALLHKRMVVDHGVVRGLRLNTVRQSGPADSVAARAGQDAAGLWHDPAAAERARDWLERLAEKFQTDPSAQLESLRLTEEFLERWPQAYADLEQQLEALRDETAQLQTEVQEAHRNPLRHVEFLEQVPSRVAAIQKQFRTLHEQLDGLPEMQAEDHAALLAARRADETFLRRQLHVEQIDNAALSAYLLQEHMQGPLGRVASWLRLARMMVPSSSKENGPRQSNPRGVDVVFAGAQPKPEVIVRRLDFDGTARLAGQSFELAGFLADFSDEPALHDQPARLVATTQSGLPLRLEATFDRTGSVPRDQVVVDCEQVVLPRLKLGGSSGLSLRIEPTRATIRVTVLLTGDRLSGDVEIIQHDPQITAELSDRLQQLRLAKAVQDATRHVAALRTRVTLSGTLDEPHWNVTSDLAPLLADAFDRASDEAAARRAGELLAAARRESEQRLAELDGQLEARAAGLRRELAGSIGKAQTLASDSRSEEAVSFEHLGRRLPAQSLFR